MRTLLWLDDFRNPYEDDWLVFSPIHRPFNVVWAKSYDDFVSWIKTNGLPDGICFDHDLGLGIAIENHKNGMSKRQARKLKKLEKTGMDCANWLVEYCMDNYLLLPKFNIQSSNPVGAENIRTLLNNFNDFNSK